MTQQLNNTKFVELRKTYDSFIYHDYSYNWDSLHVNLEFHFSVDNEIYFTPKLQLKFHRSNQLDVLPDKVIKNIVFHIGMVELISYWKSLCPKKVIVKPYKLDKFQIEWWKKTYFMGLGEFFHINGILTDQNTFMDIFCEGEEQARPATLSLEDNYMVPVGGGKDSVVTLNLLKEKVEIVPMAVNPGKNSLDCINLMGFSDDNFIHFKRTLDTKLLELNTQGFLNGHTPFSALLAFVSLLGAAAFGIKNIALSNESSANEPTIIGTDVNHQYSKSFEFENDFRNYYARYISPDFNYFSFLRPFKEIQIAKLFASYNEFHAVFRSCNAGSKTNSWCCNCSKCLFAFIILSPFIEISRLIEIFGENLFAKKSLQSVMKELIGESEEKPFECIGTIDEVNMALCEFVRKNPNRSDELIDFYKLTNSYSTFVSNNFDAFMMELGRNHFLNAKEFEILENSL
jgi:hypothetical protein